MKQFIDESNIDRGEEFLAADGEYWYEDVIDPFELVQEFILRSNQLEETNVDYEDLIAEESMELQEALINAAQVQGDKEVDAHVLKEMCDLIYVLIGYAIQNKWDIGQAFLAVHESNMSKGQGEGGFIYSPSGKIIKGPYYYKPNLTDYV